MYTTRKHRLTAGIVLAACLAHTSSAQTTTLKGTIISEKAMDAFVRYQMDSLKIPALSLAVLQHGRVVYYKADGIKNDKLEHIDTNTVFEAASMTKPVFAYAVHRLVRRGQLALDTPLYRYYPFDDIDHDERYKKITARMVLSHTTGFPNWRPCGSCELTINAEPGTTYGYSGEGYEYLALVVKHLLNQRVEDLMHDEVLGPLGMHHSFMTTTDEVREHLADGMRDNTEWGWNNRSMRPHVAYSLYTEAREYARFVLQLMKESREPGSTFQQMSVPQVQSEPGKWACLGLFMEETPYGMKYSHSGNNNNRFNSNFEFYKDHDLGYVFFMNCHQEPAFTKRFNAFLENGE